MIQLIMHLCIIFLVYYEYKLFLNEWTDYYWFLLMWMIFFLLTMSCLANSFWLFKYSYLMNLYMHLFNYMFTLTYGMCFWLMWMKFYGYHAEQWWALVYYYYRYLIIYQSHNYYYYFIKTTNYYYFKWYAIQLNSYEFIMLYWSMILLFVSSMMMYMWACFYPHLMNKNTYYLIYMYFLNNRFHYTVNLLFISLLICSKIMGLLLLELFIMLSYSLYCTGFLVNMYFYKPSAHLISRMENIKHFTYVDSRTFNLTDSTLYEYPYNWLGMYCYSIDKHYMMINYFFHDLLSIMILSWLMWNKSLFSRDRRFELLVLGYSYYSIEQHIKYG